MTERYHQKVIRIRAEDSPNVARGIWLRQHFPRMPLEVVFHFSNMVPGVLSYREYLTRRKTWDKVRQCIGLDAEFYEGAELLLFPPEWLNLGEKIAAQYHNAKDRRAKGVGVDPAEGGDQTSMVAVDEIGIIACESIRTPDTSVIEGRVIAFLNRHGVSADRCCIDRGGGGKQLADNLRARGLGGIRTIGFGENPSLDVKRGLHSTASRRDVTEQRGTYINMRAQMYNELSQLFDPAQERAVPSLRGSIRGFGIPVQGVGDLRLQLAVIPKQYDREGRLKLPPKNKTGASSSERSLVEMIGHSPDEADALVLAVHAMLHRRVGATIRAIG